MTAPDCFQPTPEAQHTLDLLTAMLREERKRARLQCQEACAEVRREPTINILCADEAVQRCIEAIAQLK